VKEVSVYALLDPRVGKARYVGRSVDPERRLSEHVTRARKGLGRSHRCNWIRQLDGEGLRPGVVVLEHGLTADESVVAERWWILKLRSLGLPLVNHTDGGEGSRGKLRGPMSEAQKRKLSEAKKGHPPTPGMTGKRHSAETRRALSDRKREAWASGKFKDRRSCWTPERRAAHAERIRLLWKGGRYVDHGEKVKEAWAEGQFAGRGSTGV